MEWRTTAKLSVLGSSRYRDGAWLDFTVVGRDGLCAGLESNQP